MQVALPVQVMSPNRGSEVGVVGAVGVALACALLLVHHISCLVVPEAGEYTPIPLPILLVQPHLLFPPEQAGQTAALPLRPLHSSNRVRPSMVLAMLCRRHTM
jgi:hypothetical protein